MRILSLELENIKSYDRAFVKFSDGVNAIMGHNGAGKSTLVEAIGFALFDSLEYTKDAFKREGATGGEVKVDFEGEDGRRYQVTRGVGSGNSYYITDYELGGRLCTGSANVTAFLRGQMGLDADGDLTKLFRDAVGVPQGTLTAAFLLPPSARKPVFDPLLHVEEYRTAYARLSGPAGLLSERITQLNEEIALHRGALLQLPAVEQRTHSLASEKVQAAVALESANKKLKQARAEVERLDGLRSAVIAADKVRADARSALAMAHARAQTAHIAFDEATEARKLVAANQMGHDRYLAAQESRLALEARAHDKQQLELKRIAAQGDLAHATEKRTAALALLAEIRDSEERLKALAERVAEQDALEARRTALLAQQAVRETLAKETAAIRVSLQNESRQRDNLQQQLAALPAFEAEQAEVAAQLEAVAAEMEQAASQKALIEGEGKHVRLLFDALSSTEGLAVCPVCRQPLNETHRHQLLEEYGAERERMSVEWTSLSEAVKAAKEREQLLAARRADLALQQKQFPQQSALDQANRKVSELGVQLEDAEHRLAEVDGAPAALAGVKAQLDALGNPRGERDRLQHMVSGTQAAQTGLARAEEDAGAAAAQLSACEADLVKYAGIAEEMSQLNAQIAEDLPAYQAVLTHASAANLVEQRRAEVEAADEAEKGAADVHTQAEAALLEATARVDLAAFAAAQTEANQLQGDVGALNQRLLTLEAEERTHATRLAELREHERKQSQALAHKTELQVQDQHLARMRSAINQAGPKITQALIQIVGERAATFFSELMGDSTRWLLWGGDYGIKLEVSGHERDFASLSGGEQMMAALSVRLALLREMTRVDFAIFDEPTAHLDDARREALASQIMAVRGFRQIFVISHDSAFEHLTENVIRVERVGGVSRVIA